MRETERKGRDLEFKRKNMSQLCYCKRGKTERKRETQRQRETDRDTERQRERGER